MNPRDEGFRGTIINCLTLARLDTRNLAIEVGDGTVSITGSVPTQEQRRRLDEVLTDQVQRLARVECNVGVKVVAASDNVTGRGRSPLTGTSEGSAHESRHQVDR